MSEIPINLSGNLTITIHCNKCYNPLEASFIVVSEPQQIVISIDTEHNCDIRADISSLNGWYEQIAEDDNWNKLK